MPEASKPAQEPILRLRQASPAQYVTHAGRRVACAGYVDDAEHYGAARAPPTCRSLSRSSVSVAWRPASGSPGRSSLRSRPTGTPSSPRPTRTVPLGRLPRRACLLPASLPWVGDIWRGGTSPAQIPRAHVDSVEKLLGKRGPIGDRHSVAAEDLLSRLKGVCAMATAKKCAWDEVAALYQLVVRAVLSYAPLVGVLDAGSLHSEDSALRIPEISLVRIGHPWDG